MSLSRVCDACGETTAAPVARCGCGEPLWLDTPIPAFDWVDATDDPGLWRYTPVLPVEPPGGLADAAGGTPLLRADSLDERVGGARVHVKVEGHQPTGSFKDRGSALGVAAVAERAAAGSTPAVGTVSHGNMAMSTAAFAAEAGLPCVVLVPADIPEERLGVIAQYDPTLLRVAGDYGELYRQSLDVGEREGITFLNSDAPLRVEGQKTTGIELCDAFAPDVPDGIVLPVSSGGHASGVWKAVRELRAAGTIDRLPPLYAVQASACAPIAEAFAAGREAVTPVEGGETIAYSIANADPPSGTRVLRAVRETGGRALSVDDDAIRAAKRTLATEVGLSVETASAVALAGAERLAAEGVFGPGDDVALVATGTGLKEAAGETPDAETVHIADVGDRLTAFAE